MDSLAGPPVNHSDLQPGSMYVAFVPQLANRLNDGSLPPNTIPYVLLKYIGRAIESTPDEEPLESSPPCRCDGGCQDCEWTCSWFSINNHGGPDIPLRYNLLGTNMVLEFDQDPIFSPWDRNLLLESATSFQVARKWRPSRDHRVQIPEPIVEGNIEFYKFTDDIEAFYAFVRAARGL